MTFKKKVQQVVENQETEVVQTPENKKEIDIKGLISDLMHNKYFQIMEKEASPIAKSMIEEGASYLCNIRWFLTQNERLQLSKELAEKYCLEWEKK